jgi:hypothetical protein
MYMHNFYNFYNTIWYLKGSFGLSGSDICHEYLLTLPPAAGPWMLIRAKVWRFCLLFGACRVDAVTKTVGFFDWGTTTAFLLMPEEESLGISRKIKMNCFLSECRWSLLKMIELIAENCQLEANLVKYRIGTSAVVNIDVKQKRQYIIIISCSNVKPFIVNIIPLLVTIIQPPIWTKIMSPNDLKRDVRIEET